MEHPKHLVEHEVYAFQIDVAPSIPFGVLRVSQVLQQRALYVTGSAAVGLVGVVSEVTVEDHRDPRQRVLTHPRLPPDTRQQAVSRVDLPHAALVDASYV